MSNTLKLYTLNYILEENAVYDDLDTYLALQNPNAITIQQQRLEKEKTIVLNLLQNSSAASEFGVSSAEALLNLQGNNKNYAVIEGDPKMYYYILNIRRMGKDSIAFDLLLHTAQTFKSLYTLSPICKIEREHVNRFAYSESLGKYYAIVDPVDEGFNVDHKNLAGRYIINASSSSEYALANWYAVYYSDTTSESSPIRTYLLPEDSRTLTVNTKYYSNDISIEDNILYMLLGSEHSGDVITFNNVSTTMGIDSGYDETEFILFKGYGTWNSGTPIDDKFHLCKINIKHNANYNSTSRIEITSASGTSATFAFTTNYSKKLYKANCPNSSYLDIFTNSASPFAEHRIFSTEYVSAGTTATVSATLNSFKDISLVDPHLVKVVKLPYFPFNYSTSSSLFYEEVNNSFNNFKALRVKDTASMTGNIISKYKVDMSVEQPNDLYTHAIDIAYESKFYNSAYAYYALEYGPYSVIARPEKYNLEEGNYVLQVTYSQAKLKSDLYFNVQMMQTDGLVTGYLYFKDGYSLSSPFELKLVSDINNEVPIYTSDYVNYVKTGYNYDKASVRRQATVNSINAGISLVSGGLLAATGGIGLAAGVGVATRGLTSAIGVINSTIASEAQIEKKLNSYKNSSTGISGVSDVELRELYGDFKAYITQYEPTLELCDELLNLWHKYGYASTRIGTPNTDTRIYFNFVKLKECYFVDNTCLKQYSEYLDEIKELYLEGIYYYHLVNNNYLVNKEYENFEKIFEEVHE